jgi:ABC-type glutathione transport system ATPase component
MQTDSLLSILELSKIYEPRRWFLPAHSGCPAIQRVTIQLKQGHILGITGPSGSGKSTLARCIALVDPPTSGNIWLNGRNLWQSTPRERAVLRSSVQLIFQQPAASLNPRFTAGDVISEPLVIRKLGTQRTRRKRVFELMELAGLPANAIDTPAPEWSGGERQRLAIARALAVEPKLLILDESLSSLDLSVRAQITNLLLDLKEQRGLTSILISHELPLIASVADDIAVMERGVVVEQAPVCELLNNPQHACTKKLLNAARTLAQRGLSG